jgi:hypothetical protein
MERKEEREIVMSWSNFLLLGAVNCRFHLNVTTSGAITKVVWFGYISHLDRGGIHIRYYLSPCLPVREKGGGEKDVGVLQGVTKRCCLYFLTKSALVYEPKFRGDGGGGGLRGRSQ